MSERSSVTGSLRISLVTPNWNAAQFLERTVVSVLNQNYPNLEYVVVDGASTDGSLEIIERHRPRLAAVVSEPDEGHTEAINKGFELTEGEIMGWINSDDMLLPGCLAAVNQVFRQFPHVDWITGRATAMTEDDIVYTVREARPWSWLRFLGGDYRHIQQESTFWRRRLWDKAGAQLSTDHKLASDFELWTRFFLHAPLYSVDALFGSFRFRGGQQSRASAEEYEAEAESALRALWERVPANALAEHADVLATHDSLQPSFDFPSVSPALAAADPPVIAMDPGTREFTLSDSAPAVPSSTQAVDVTSAELTFDGKESVVWRSGPDFARADFVALEARLCSRLATPQEQPATPLLAGPVALYDYGAGRFIVEVACADQTISEELTSDTGDLRIRVVVGDDSVLIVREGEVLTRARGRANRRMPGATSATIGTGSIVQSWSGRVAVLRLTSKARDGSVQTHELRNQEGESTQPPAGALVRDTHVGPAIRRLANAHRGQRCFVMGNGPSLNQMNLESLAGESVFACNAAFLLFERISWRPQFYTCVDVRVLRDRATDITSMLEETPEITAFFPSQITLHDGSGRAFDTRTIIPPAANRYYFDEVANSMAHPPHSMFSLDASDHLVQPYTVAITMLQLAAYLGFNPIYLIGCDTSYSIPASVKQEGKKVGEGGLLLTSTADDDPNHFDPRYFGRNREWHNPQVEKMIEHHRWAKIALDRRGVEVFNATVGGKLEVYPRVDFDELVNAKLVKKG